ncbi:hypothetical protein ACFT2C_05355 [Promicromonospora sp. NPDC057138]|uniref:hypothetical protein n=1 Tax=Promicromonospora sp. NPDC057138 TaxID=3346031 RepID=UPI0036423666
MGWLAFLFIAGGGWYGLIQFGRERTHARRVREFAAASKEVGIWRPLSAADLRIIMESWLTERRLSRISAKRFLETRVLPDLPAPESGDYVTAIIPNDNFVRYARVLRTMPASSPTIPDQVEIIDLKTGERIKLPPGRAITMSQETARLFLRGLGLDENSE